MREANRRILLMVLALAAVLLATLFIGIVYAKPPTSVSGTIEFTEMQQSAPPRRAGESDNRFVLWDIIEDWSGDIEGTATVEAKWIVHNSPLSNPAAWVNAHVIITFSDVTVLGMTGSLTIKLSFLEGKGQWTILEGTGELANVHGQGKVSDVTMTYTGKVHFDP